MRIVRWVLAVALFAGLFYASWEFVARNSEPMGVHYVAGEIVDVARWLVLTVCFLGGATAMGLVFVYQQVKSGLVARRYRRTVARLEAEIHQLRNLPLAVGELLATDTASNSAPNSRVRLRRIRWSVPRTISRPQSLCRNAP